jgi:S-methylmethionine-dependent homocysteine/selenocysteine methylase
MTQFEKCFTSSKFILTEGAIVERLKSEFHLTMDQCVNHAGLIYTNPDILAKLYKQYIAVAQKHDLPIMLMTPTRKVNAKSMKYSDFMDQNLIVDACEFMNKIKDEYPSFKDKIFIGGLLGCKGDAYQSDDALVVEEAFQFHQIQVAEFKKGAIDFMFAGIMPALSEAIGMARAMATSGIPYIISFMIRKDGCLLDGTSITEAIRIIDAKVSPQPVCCVSNCVHPANLLLALENEVNRDSPQLKRFLGIQANASSLSPEELNNCGILQQENFDEMIDQMNYLHEKFHFKILGGCCGTNDQFIDKLADKLVLETM